MVASSFHTCVHPLPAIVSSATQRDETQPDYCYEGYCDRTGKQYRLPRTPLAKAVARQLMQQLQREEQFNHEGKMYGVLLVQLPEGEVAFLKAFSGLLRGNGVVPGWVPSIPGRERVALQEAHTLRTLGQITHRLLALQQLPERQTYTQQLAQFDRQRQTLNQRHRQRKLERDQLRQKLWQLMQGAALDRALHDLEQQSRGDKAELRAFKQTKAHTLAPLLGVLQAADAEITALKARRKQLSRQLQADLHRAYSLTNFAGQSLTVQDLAENGQLPTGTGDCCAPKLLHFAAEHGCTPVAMAEFWWGPGDAAGKQAGEFYGACTERCQPIMGFLLSGLSTAVVAARVEPDFPLPILYEDDWLVVVNKPAGLLSVPGRYGHRQDSVLSRLRHQRPRGNALVAVHRLDQDTSGVLVLTYQGEGERHLRQQFEAQKVNKVYEALLEGRPAAMEGTISLPLWGNPQDRPRQSVDWQQGKTALTHYHILGHDQEGARLEFYPKTGRTHQLRVHAAHPQGLNAPIRGDRLYGTRDATQRLCLHARELRIWHPWQQRELEIKALTPF